MSVKIAIIGAGSGVFTLNIVRDIFTYPSLAGCELYLMDIDARKLSLAQKLVGRIISEGKYKATVVCTMDRKEAIRGADFIVNTAYIGSYETMAADFAIMNKYGISQCIGDTMGPDAVMRAQRALPVFLEMAREINEMAAKGALLLNYSNPMAMLTWGMVKATGVNAVGLCHGVECTVTALADYVGVPKDSVEHLIAGINHQAWILQFCSNGVDMLPKFKELAENPNVYRKDIVRWEMYRQLGYFCTESSGHDSEYNPWFRKRADLEAQYCSGFSFSGERDFHLRHYDPKDRASVLQMQAFADGKGHLDLGRSIEYCAGIINACITGEAFAFNGNKLNDNYISNLPQGCCVEVPCVASLAGIKAQNVGALPEQLASLNRMQIQSQDFSVRAALELDEEMLFYSLCYDPLTAAVLSLDEIRNMTLELLKVEPDYLPKYKKLLHATPAVIPFDYKRWKYISTLPKKERFTAQNIIDQYWLAGPFAAIDKDGKKGLGVVHRPEKHIDFDEEMYCPFSKKRVAWREVTTSDMEENGSVDLLKRAGIDPYSIAYAVSMIECAAGCNVKLLVGSDEGIAIWINGSNVFFHDIGRPLDMDQDCIDLKLQKGVNTLLFKINQSLGYWGFIARLETMPGGVRYLNTAEMKDVLKKTALPEFISAK